MAIRVFNQITVIFAEAANFATPPIPKRSHYMDIRVLELSDGQVASWELSVSKSVMQKNSRWSIKLSEEESRQLEELLRNLPFKNLSSAAGMLDGSETDMEVIRKNEKSSFHWEVSPWNPISKLEESTNQHETSDMEVWSKVGAVADFITHCIGIHQE